MLIGEAPGPSTQRLTGLPYIGPDGQMSTTGRTLDGFLSRFGYTIDPDGPGQYAYSTDLVHCVPLKPEGRRGRTPLPREIENCGTFLDEGIALLSPQVVILLGRHAAQTFFRRHLGRTVRTLANVIGGPYDAIVAGVSVAAFAVYHPSSEVRMRAERELVYRRVAADVKALLSAP
jgi:uracil-DNA glycosylase